MPWNICANTSNFTITIIEHRVAAPTNYWYIFDGREPGSDYYYGLKANPSFPNLADGALVNSGYCVTSWHNNAVYRNKSSLTVIGPYPYRMGGAGVRFFGKYTDSDPYSVSTIVGLYVHNKQLTQQEHSELVDSPWQIFASSPRRIWFDAGAGGGAFTVDAQPGTFAVSGTAATLARGLALDAQPGTFAVNGTAATLAKGRQLDAQPGTFTVNGTAATLARGLAVNAQPGTFAVNGTAATLEKTTAGAFTIDAQPGTFSISGTAATLAYGRKFDAQPGTFSLSGTAASLTKNAAQAFELDAQPGAFSLTGTAATLTYNGASIWTDVGASSTTWGDVSASSTTWSDL